MGLPGGILPLREVFLGDDVSLDKNKGVFQDPLELPDVARPVILLEERQDFGVQSADILMILLI
jgi:hypothetical protein